MKINDFKRFKSEKRPITMVTAYDAWTSRLLSECDVDCLLVGDSVAMVVHGFESTVRATVPMMETHVAAVHRGCGGKKFIVGDLPFMATFKGKKCAMGAVERLVRAGAAAVKIENVDRQETVFKNCRSAGVPVMAHLGLTPQSEHALGGYRVQGRDEAEREEIIRRAEKVQELGAFALVLECIPASLAQELSQRLEIPTIGIGAGVHVDGQVLVTQDLLGLSGSFKPKFLRQYLDGQKELTNAVNRFNLDVKNRHFPSLEESY